jgi:hypothetical protein
VRRIDDVGGREKECFRASHRQTGNEHLLGEFERAGGVELALQEKADIERKTVLKYLASSRFHLEVDGKAVAIYELRSLSRKNCL